MVFGTFDLLHLGHIDLFRQAKELGDRLTVVISRDKRAEAVKGSFPRHTEEERRRLVSHIDYVDDAVLGDAEDVYRVIEERQPDIIALGYDQEKFVDALAGEITSRGLSASVVRLEPYEDHRYKGKRIKEDVISNA